MKTWQQQLKDASITPEQLAKRLELDIQQLPAALQAAQDFALRAPEAFIARMQKSNPQDPLLLQVLPQAAELDIATGFNKNPLQESQYTPTPGLLHKYKSRALIITTGACAINCRYCFRRHFAYQENALGQAGWDKIIDYLQQHPEIHEVILSGGDPLVAKDNYLQQRIQQLETITHLDTIRIHTRLPIVLPDRVTPDLINLLASSRLRAVVVLHCNHAQEIDEHVMKACQALQQQHITLLNQTVLLKHINDQVDTLAQLSKRLFAANVLPYYLHLLDSVAGAAHFDVPKEQAKILHQQLKYELPGYLVPKLVQEVPGELAKCWL